MSDSAQANAARLVPLLTGLVNGAAPVSMSLLIIAPLWLARAGVDLPLPPVLCAIATALLCMFGLGVFLGRVGGTSWLWGGIKTVLIALLTIALIFLLER